MNPPHNREKIEFKKLAAPWQYNRGTESPFIFAAVDLTTPLAIAIALNEASP